VKGHLVDAVFHRANASFRCVSGSVHLGSPASSLASTAN
jgi:hypothetical protein